MKKSKNLVCLLFIFGLIPGSVWGESLDLVFYFPGGQGSQMEAQPILDSFSEGLEKASGGKIKAKVIYLRETQEGTRFIQNKKPAGGILALDVFYQKAQPWKAQVIAQTLQLPSGDGKDQYYLLGHKAQDLPTSGKLKVLASRPLLDNFVNQKLFPEQKFEMEIEASPVLVSRLRKIGRGEEKGWVLLDNFEYTTISRLNSQWTKNIKPWASSQKVPSSPFVVFKDNLSPEIEAALQKALVKLSKDPAYQETLQLLRIKGFKKASPSDLGV